MRFPGLFLFIALIAGLGTGGPALAQLRADQVDFKSVYKFAELAAAAYEGAAKLKRKSSGVSWVATPGHAHVQYFIVIDAASKTQTIAVRGTIDKVNWKTNMDTLGVHDKRSGILMHRGYSAAARTIYRDLKPRLKKTFTTNLTGHSLGGAVAAILATYLFDEQYKLGRVYTFGQPKFTNPAGAVAYRNLPLIRIVHQNDGVATFPDNIKNAGKQYAQMGPMLNLLSGPYYIFIDAEKTVRFSQGSFKRFRSQLGIPDHKMKFYLKNLRYKVAEAKLVSPRDRLKYIDRKRRTPIKRSFNFGPHR
ncbi:MAG: lipase family protein [Alphaproteobacteria bacterium]|nr:lipase family protein [Alphaproteobacteria bacterium]